MKLARLAGCFCVAVSLFLGAAAIHAADDYPTKPGRLILPFGAGGSTDIIGRLFAQQFSEAWGQTLVVDNRAGAAGIVGSELGAHAAPDGYTIMTFGINQSITPALYSKIPYEPLRDFVPISQIAAFPLILAVSPKVEATSLQALIAYAKANPGKANYASSSTAFQLATELFKPKTGAPLVHISYKSSNESVMAVMSHRDD